MSNTATKKKIFAEFGIFEPLKTNNGPPFNGQKISRQAQQTGFKRKKITPLYPQANPETECFMQTRKKSISVMHTRGLNFQQENYQFLLVYRTTPTPQQAYHLSQNFWTGSERLIISCGQVLTKRLQRQTT